MQDAELVKASGYRSRSESAGFSGFSPEDDLVYKNKVIVYRINITSLFIEHACINRVRMVIQNVESHGIEEFHFPGLEGHGM